MERSGGEADGIGGGESNEGAGCAAIAGHSASTTDAGPRSEWADTPRRDGVTVAGTVSASVAGAVRQHDAASSDVAADGESTGHALQLGAAFGDIGIAQSGRSPARGAAPVTIRERRRRRLPVRRIMVLR